MNTTTPEEGTLSQEGVHLICVPIYVHTAYTAMLTH